MIKINLLPQELRRRELPFSNIKLSQFNLQNLPLFNIIVAIGSGVVALQLILFAIGIFGTVTLNGLIKKSDAIALQKREAEVLRAKVDDINMRSSAIDELMARRFGWAKKLNNLSDSITPGIWLTELDYDEKPSARPRIAAGPGQGAGKAPSRVSLPGSLIISGFASGAGEQGTALVGHFIKSLKDNADFYADFSEIVLVSARSDKVENQEVMNFKISCFFR